jgi:hypothetical protein
MVHLSASNCVGVSSTETMRLLPAFLQAASSVYLTRSGCNCHLSNCIFAQLLKALHFYSEPEVYHRAHNGTQFDPILSQLDPVHTLKG